MNRINVNKLGIAVGITGVLLYLGCLIIMLIAGKEGSVRFFNSLLHGLDTSSIIRMNIPSWETAVGMILTFIMGWLTGTSIAFIYNMQNTE